MDTLVENECPRKTHRLHRPILQNKKVAIKKGLFYLLEYIMLPGGPRIVETHSYKLSPFGPAEQFGGGSNVISASSFCIRFADVPNALEIFGFDFVSFVSGFGSAVELEELVPPPFRRFPPLEPAPVVEAPADDVDMIFLLLLLLCLKKHFKPFPFQKFMCVSQKELIKRRMNIICE